MIDVIIPTLGRPDRLQRVADDLAAAGGPTRPVFVCEATDDRSIEAAEATGAQVVINGRSANYAGAVNTAYAVTAGDMLFLAADDLHFHPGWAEMAAGHIDEQVLVVGTHDLLNPYVARGWHATHYLIARSYIADEGGTVDGGPGTVLHEGYDHSYTDTEFIGTAKARARFRPCLDAVVEHFNAWSPKGEIDETAQRTMRAITADSELYDSRKHLWWDLSR